MAVSGELGPSEVLALMVQPWAAVGLARPEQLDTLFEQLSDLVRQQAAGLTSEEALRAFRDTWLARKSGHLTALKDNWLGQAGPAWKRPLGQGLNALRAQVEASLTTATDRLKTAAATRQWDRERADISLPGRPARLGPQHPIRQMTEEIVAIFNRLGFSVGEGPEIESEYYNFEALNVPASHPARDSHDTLYLADLPGMLLRTHTTSVQIHTWERRPPPLRLVAPGKVYRRDAPDATHSPMFHQVDGVAVDRDLTFGDLKGTLDYFARALFGTSASTRFRPSFFPFTEPSAEMDVSCVCCRQAGCRICKQSGWIEILGCGMIHPAVFEAVHLDAEQWSGFAFGLGVERVAMLRYDVDDIQRFYSGDVRFLDQFRE